MSSLNEIQNGSSGPGKNKNLNLFMVCPVLFINSTSLNESSDLERKEN